MLRVGFNKCRFKMNKTKARLTEKTNIIHSFQLWQCSFSCFQWCSSKPKYLPCLFVSLILSAKLAIGKYSPIDWTGICICSVPPCLFTVQRDAVEVSAFLKYYKTFDGIYSRLDSRISLNYKSVTFSVTFSVIIKFTCKMIL